MISLMGLRVLCLGLVTLSATTTAAAGEDAVKISEKSSPDASGPGVLGIPTVSHPGARPRDCEDLQRASPTPLASGIYNIQPLGFEEPFQVSCDFETAGGGWTVFQRRIDGSVDFYRDWVDYKNGFGNLDTEFWLGNDKISKMSVQKKYKLRIELTGKALAPCYAEYSSFRLGDEATFYQLFVGSYSGNAGRDSLDEHRDMYFSTKDADHDAHDGDCAADHSGAWWYSACDWSNLNSLWGEDNNRGIEWTGLPGGEYALRFTEMKIRAA